MTSRRGFLKLFGAASVATVAGVAVLDPDALLWRPGAKLISIPAPRGFVYLDGFYFVASGKSMLAFTELHDPLTWGPTLELWPRPKPGETIVVSGVPAYYAIQPWGPRS
jgi:hypothetical protein